MKKILLSLSILTLLFTSCKDAAEKKAAENKNAEAPKTETASTPAAAPVDAKNYTVTISTEYGDMKFKLYDETPKHRDNFIKNVQDGFYNGTLFHRVIKDFMIQGGDPLSKNAAPKTPLGMGSISNPPQRIPYEFKPQYIHKKGALAAARDGNPEKASSDCQFYIVHGKKMTDAEIDGIQMQNAMRYTPEQREILKTLGGTPFLDNGYTVFGEITEGLDVLDKIASVEKEAQYGDRPVKDVKMTIKMN